MQCFKGCVMLNEYGICESTMRRPKHIIRCPHTEMITDRKIFNKQVILMTNSQAKNKINHFSKTYGYLYSDGVRIAILKAVNALDENKKLLQKIQQLENELEKVKAENEALLFEEMFK